MTRRLIVDGARCIGAGQCVRVAPEIFDQDQDTGTVVLLGPPPGPESDGAGRAVRLCPSGAIRWAGETS